MRRQITYFFLIAFLLCNVNGHHDYAELALPMHRHHCNFDLTSFANAGDNTNLIAVCKLLACDAAGMIAVHSFPVVGIRQVAWESNHFAARCFLLVSQ